MFILHRKFQYFPNHMTELHFHSSKFVYKIQITFNRNLHSLIFTIHVSFCQTHINKWQKHIMDVGSGQLPRWMHCIATDPSTVLQEVGHCAAQNNSGSPHTSFDSKQLQQNHMSDWSVNQICTSSILNKLLKRINDNKKQSSNMQLPRPLQREL